MVTNSRGAIDSIVNLNLDTKSSQAKSLATQFEEAYKDIMIPAPSAEAALTKTATSGIVAGGIFLKEATFVTTIGDGIHQGFSGLKELSDQGEAGIKPTKDALEAYVKIFDDMILEVDKARNNAIDAAGKSTYRNLATIIILYMTIFVGGFSIFLGAVIGLSVYRNLCKSFALSFGKALVSCQMVCSCTTNLVAVVLIIIGVAVTNACYFIELTYTDEAFINELDPSIKDYVGPCLLNSGNGDLSSQLDTGNLGEVNELNGVTDGFNNFDMLFQLGVLAGGPSTFNNYKPVFEGLLGFTNETEWNNFGANSPVTVSNTMEMLAGSCVSKDIFKNLASECGAKPEYTGTQTSNACFTFKSWYSASGTTAGRWPTCSNGADLRTRSTQMTTTFNAYNSYYLTGTALNATAYPDIANRPFMTNFEDIRGRLTVLMSDLDGLKPHIDSIKQSMSATLDFLPDLQGSSSPSLTKSFNCKILNREVRMFQNVLCFKLGKNIARASYILAWTGYSLFFYTCFMCCLIRYKRASEPKPQKFGRVFPDAKRPSTGTMGNRIDTLQMPIAKTGGENNEKSDKNKNGFNFFNNM